MGSTQSTKWCYRVEAKDANVQSEIKPNKLCKQRNDRVAQPSIEKSFSVTKRSWVKTTGKEKRKATLVHFNLTLYNQL